jgi:hypothetical protein
MKHVSPAARALGAAALAVTMAAPATAQADATLNRWSGQWWQWAFSLPAVPVGGGSTHPLVGNDADYGDPDLFEFCGNGQQGKLWFLGGDFAGSGEPIERTCVIPAGTTVVLPVVNFECSTAEGDAEPTDPKWKQARDLKNCTKPIGDLLSGTARFGRMTSGPGAATPTYDLKDIPVQRLITDGPYSVYFPPDNVIGLTDPLVNPSLAQADGQWVVLRPAQLKPGRYRIEFTGAFDGQLLFNGTYNLIVAWPNGTLPRR